MEGCGFDAASPAGHPHAPPIPPPTRAAPPRFYRDRPIPAHVFSAILRRLEAQELILFDADAVYRI